MRTFFNARTVRERVLLTAFLLVGFAWWGSTLLDRLGVLSTGWVESAQNSAEQRHWLENKAQVDERTAKITATLDPTKTLKATMAFEEVQRMAQGLSAEVVAQRTERTENITLNNLQVTIRQTDLASFNKFYQQLSQRKPYLGIEHCAISSVRSAPDQISAVLKIYAVEVLNPAP